METNMHEHICPCGQVIAVPGSEKMVTVVCPGCSKRYHFQAKPRLRPRQNQAGAVSIPAPIEGRPHRPMRPRAGKPVRTAPRATQKPVDNTGQLQFTLALIGLLFCQVLSPFAWFSARKKEEELIAADVSVPGLLVAGKIVGLVGSIYLGLWAVFMVLWMLMWIVS